MDAAPYIPTRYEDSDYRDTRMGFRQYPIYPSKGPMNQATGYDFDVNGKFGNMRGHASGSMTPRDEEEPMTKERAEAWVNEMENADGTRGPHWKYDAIMQTMKQKGISCDPAGFYAAMNMVYSDYCVIAKKYNVNTVDFYCGLAKAFLDDEDAKENKLEKYYEYVVK